MIPSRISSENDGRNGPVGRVEIPVRVVGGKHEEVVAADHVDDLQQVSGVFRLLHRLRRRPEVLADVLTGQLLEPRDFVAQPPVVLVKAPHQRRQPGKPAFDQRDAQVREGLEDAFGDQAEHLCLEGLRHARVVLDVVRRPTRGRDGTRDRRQSECPRGKAHVARRGKNGPESPAPVGRGGAHDQEHLNEPRVATGAADLGCGRLGIFRVHNDRAAPPRVMVQPARRPSPRSPPARARWRNRGCCNG